VQLIFFAGALAFDRAIARCTGGIADRQLKKLIFSSECLLAKFDEPPITSHIALFRPVKPVLRLQFAQWQQSGNGSQ
jgi:hypothetical protein